MQINGEELSDAEVILVKYFFSEPSGVFDFRKIERQAYENLQRIVGV